MKIQFEGAAKTVTGSQTVITHHGYSAMVDCGLYQGPKPLQLLNLEQPPYLKVIKSILLA